MTVFSRHPVDNPSISQPFANVNGREATNHLGTDYRPDYPGQVGKIIYAPCDMFVVWARGGTFAADNPWEQMPNNGNNGNSVIGVCPAPHQATYSMYCHMDEIWVKEGQFVTAGTALGTMGWTGYIIPNDPNGTHLHWEVFIDYADGAYPEGTFYGRVNPLDYFKVATITPVAPGAGGSAATEEEDMALTNEDIDKIADRVLTKVVTDNKGKGQNSLAWVLTSQRASRDEDRRLLADSIKGAVATIVAAIKGAK
ncbi:M23 family metallopeptidase [Arthrobacter sp. CP30]